MKKFVHSFDDHLARYVFALTHCPRKDVLDAGGSDGFGAHLLGYGANTITLADISQGALNNAKKWFKPFAPTNYVQCDFEKSFPEGSWDVITAFEVIEHLTPEGGDLFVKNCSEHLRPGGKLVFSVPHMVANHEHKTLYNEEKIKAVMTKHLDLVEYYVQDKKSISGKPCYNNLKCHVGIAIKR